ncbi:DAK2 domain-containing protein [Microbacterium lacticum]
MNAKELTAAISTACERVVAHVDELRDLDQVLGDGDLGITVQAGADAVRAALAELPADATPTSVAQVCAKAFANANPSTMAALVAGALLAGARVWNGKAEVDRAEGAAFVQAAADSISSRGKSKVGDKTILDALVPVADALANGVGDARSDAQAAAADGVERTIDMQSQRGRASWLQERSIGHRDPGATALLRFVEAWQ